MTINKRYARGLGISLLVHAGLLGTALWLWRFPSVKTEPETARWEVSLLPSPGNDSSSPVMEPPPPPLAASPEPTVDVLPQPLAAEPQVADSLPGGPAAGFPKLALPAASGADGGAGVIQVPLSNLMAGADWAPAGSGNPAATGSATAFGPGGGAGANLSPIVRIPPTYPLEARRRKIEGWVRTEFTVLEDGSVTDIRVKKAEPNGVFDQAAIDAIAHWKFQPASENGRTVRRRAGQTLRFELNR